MGFAFSPNLKANVYEAMRLSNSLGKSLFFLHVGAKSSEKQRIFNDILNDAPMGPSSIKTIWESGDPVKVITHQCKKNNIDFEMKRLDCWSPGYHRRSLLKIIENEGAQNFNELINNNKSKITINLRNNLLFGKNITNETIKTLKHDLKDLKKRIVSTFEEYDLIIMPTTPQNSFNISNKVPENQANFTSLANIADLPSLCLPFYSKNKQPSSLQLISSNMNDEFLIKISSFFEKILQ